MKYAIAILACSLISAAPGHEEPTVSQADAMAAQRFVFATSTHAFNGDRLALYRTLSEMGDEFTALYILTRGPLGDMPIELPGGHRIKVRDYVDRVVDFAQLPEVS